MRAWSAALVIGWVGLGCASGALEEPAGGSNNTTRPDMTRPGSDMPVDQGANNNNHNNHNDPDLGPLPMDCSPLLQDCPDGAKCVLDSQLSTICVPARASDRVAGASCSSITDCIKGTLCVLWAGNDTGRCETICDRAQTPSACINQGTCSSGIGGRDDFGLCASGPVPCDLVLQDCDGGLACVLRDGQTRCGQAGSIVEAAPCGEAVMGTCARGLFCARKEQGQSPECVRACTPGATPTQCTNQRTCAGRTESGLSFCR
jgi:hypothetical protein